MIYTLGDLRFDLDRLELTRGGEPIELQPKVRDFLRVLLESGGRSVSKDELLERVWPGVTVDEASLQRVASLARRVLGEGAGELLHTVRGVGYRLDAKTEAGSAAAPASGLEQEIRFCTTPDGVKIAHAAVGSGPALVRCLGWFTNLEMEWRWAEGRRFWERLARRHRLIRYDGRGIGLSDPSPRFSAQTRLADLEAVVEALGLERFSLMGMSEGTSTAIRFAARHPDRVSRLVLYGPPARVVAPLGPEERERWRTLAGMIRQGWGHPSPVYRQFFAGLFLGAHAAPEMLHYFAEMQRASASADTAARYVRSLSDLDASEEAARVRVPTLVVHRRDDVLCPFSAGRELAALIPTARFLPLEGDNHWLLLEDPGAEAYAGAIEEFLE